VVFQLREHVNMPLPGDAHPARLTLTWRDLAWDAIYVPVVNAVRVTADKVNTLQFLTIRQYLSLVFVALIALLLGIAIWA
jgi:hypothetical protein